MAQGAEISGWQIGSTIVTAVGVLVALALAVWSWRQRQSEREAEQLADARLFRVHGINQSTIGPQTEKVAWVVVNHGPAAVFDVRYELWRPGDALTPKNAVRGSSDDDVVLPGQMGGADAGLGDDHPVRPTIPAWRVIWTDRYGNQWVVDHPKQITPRRFEPGQVPRTLADVERSAPNVS